MKSQTAFGWFARCGIALIVALAAMVAIATTLPPAPPLPIGRTGARATVDHYMTAPVPEIVLVGSSLTARLKGEYFDDRSLRVIGLGGGSALTALSFVLSRDQLPKYILIEMNVLDRGEDQDLIRTFLASASTFPRPIRSGVALYERWRHTPPSSTQVRDHVDFLLRSPPQEFDNTVYQERAMRENSGPPAAAVIERDILALVQKIKQIEGRGGKVFFYTVPYSERLQASRYVLTTASLARAAFPDAERWLQPKVPMEELRWPDGAHLDERSAIIVAREIGRLIDLLRLGKPKMSVGRE